MTCSIQHLEFTNVKTILITAVFFAMSTLNEEKYQDKQNNILLNIELNSLDSKKMNQFVLCT